MKEASQFLHLINAFGFLGGFIFVCIKTNVTKNGGALLKQITVLPDVSVMYAGAGKIGEWCNLSRMSETNFMPVHLEGPELCSQYQHKSQQRNECFSILFHQ